MMKCMICKVNCTVTKVSGEIVRIIHRNNDSSNSGDGEEKFEGIYSFLSWILDTLKKASNDSNLRTLFYPT